MRRVVGVMGVVGLVGAAALLGISSAGAGPGVPPTVTIKTVGLNAPPGTQFTTHLACNTAQITPPGGGGPTDELDFTFTVNAAGETVPDGTNTVQFVGNTPCSATQTVSGGAISTSYECADNLASITPTEADAATASAEDPGAAAAVPGPFCLTTGPQADPMQLQVNWPGEVVTVTVTNTFAVEVAPVTFTG